MLTLSETDDLEGTSSLDPNNDVKQLLNPNSKELHDHPDKLMQRSLEFYRSNTPSVEIFFQNNLYRIYFPMPPKCWNLSKATRSRFMDEVNRDTT